MRQKTNYSRTTTLSGEEFLVKDDDKNTRKDYRVYKEGSRYFTLTSEFDRFTGGIVTDPVRYPPADIQVIE